jgi:pilus assembly protein Flp/PilA
MQTRMLQNMAKVLSSLCRDESGGEVLEYALVAGLIVIAAIAIISSVGTKVLAKWTSLNSHL